MTVDDNKSFLLLFGTQTGNAKAIAERIADDAKSYGFVARLESMSSIGEKFQLEEETCVVIITSTTGDCEPPDNVQKFWRLLRKKMKADDLHKVNYALLGLGDTNYSTFCWCGKAIEGRLQELGAKSFYASGFADDGTGLEIVVEPWIDGLWPALRRHLSVDTSVNDQLTPSIVVTSGNTSNGIDGTSSPQLTNGDAPLRSEKSEDGQNAPVQTAAMFTLNEQLMKPSSTLVGVELTLPPLPTSFLRLDFAENNERFESYKNSSRILPAKEQLPFAKTPVSMVTVVGVDQMTADDAVKKAMLLQLDVTKCEWDYEPGDSIGIVCRNDDEEVNQLIDRLGEASRANVACTVTVRADSGKKNAAVPAHVTPVNTSIRYLLTHCCDIRASLKKALLRALCEYTTDASERRRLQELCSRQGSDDYNTLVITPAPTLLDFLRHFSSCRPPVALLLEHLPRLLPRYYSIASSPLTLPSTISIVFNVLDIAAGQSRLVERKGVCTGWLESDAVIGSQIPVYMRSTQTFRMPSDLSIPLILIGPGTGVAPFIGFLQHRQALAQNNGGVVCGPVWLFFGCRHKDRDYLFQHQLENFVGNGTLSRLLVSFSRDVPKDTESTVPRYVQDNLRLCGAEVVTLLTQSNAHVYVCGDAKGMSKSVYECFVTIITEHTELDKEGAEAFIAQLRRERHYCEDVWA